MSPLMTEDLLSRIKEALEGVTPGPWFSGLTPDGDNSEWCVSGSPDDGGDIVCEQPDGAEESMARWPRNRAYIALLSPENVSALIGEVERLREALKASSDAHEILLREWMYAPFPKEAQVLGGMSPPRGPFAAAANAIAVARQSLQGTGE